MKEIVRVNGLTRRITSAMKINGGNEKFPVLEDYGITKDEFDDYVIEKQDILDCMEERKTHLAVPGTILVIPVVVVSLFTYSVTGLLAGVAAGVVLAGGYMLAMKAADRRRLNKLYDERIERYIDDILNF